MGRGNRFSRIRFLCIRDPIPLYPELPGDHAFALSKYQELGIDYALKETQTPTADRVKNANEILETAKYTGWMEK